MSAAMFFLLGGGRVLKVGDEALGKMLAHRQLAGDAPEAGGVLLGRRTDEGHLLIDEVSEPLESDVRTRFAFHRSAGHQVLIDIAHEQSAGTCGWLGEWHTHAEPDPKPSEVDIEDWRRRVREDVFDGGEVVFLIVGQQRLRAWSCNRAGAVVALHERAAPARSS